MDRQEWLKRIKTACEDAGTYRPYFDSVIETLAGVMETRDEAERQFIEGGGETVVTHVNKAKQENTVKNPALVMVDELNKTALTYWRDLGLTPAGLKRIGESVVTVQKGGSFEEVLSKIGI